MHKKLEKNKKMFHVKHMDYETLRCYNKSVKKKKGSQVDGKNDCDC